MRDINQAKRRAAYQFLLQHYGAERADFLIGQGWTDIYADLRRNGYAWSERKGEWIKSQRAVRQQKKSTAPLKRYEYARITLNCAVADVDILVGYWSTLVDLYGYKTWNYQTDAALDKNETTRLTLFIRREITNGD